LVVLVETLFICSGFHGLKYTLYGIFFGYFYADFSIGIDHFFMDNYLPQSTGYRHHDSVAKVGFREEELKKDMCSPFCHPGPCKPCTPCSPCMPKKDIAVMKNVNTTDNSRNEFTDLLADEEWNSATQKFIFLILLVPLFGGYGTVIALMTIIVESMNMISGTGAADYFAHFPEKAPFFITVLQGGRLLMNAKDHEFHHKNPHMHYCYFSPITNKVLNSIWFWDFFRKAVEIFCGIKATVPSALE
jgi:hypothetical protein